MWQEARHQKIRAKLLAFGQITVDNIVEELGVSRETIRRDLLEMEQAGALRRVRGGAVLPAREDTAFSTRITLRLQEKRAIAATALQLLSSGMTIFMDAGSTISTMAEALAGPHDLRDLTILTNSFEVARQLAERPTEIRRNFRVLMLAGEVKHDPEETFGEATINDICRYHADVALLAPWGINASSGAMNYFLHGAEIARAMARNADKTIILADHSKIGIGARSVFAPPEAIDHLVTDPASRQKPGFDELQRALASLIVAE